ncbi:hypothetical protein SLA2020_026690 [Shorea laevis]
MDRFILFVGALTSVLASIEGSTAVNRSSFPDGFIFGAASSAYQYEGATNVDGRKPSIWDTFVKEYPDKISDRSSGDVAEEFYYMFKEDIGRMKEIGLDSFRFSISWPRILPLGKIRGGINKKGINFYNSLIDHLLSNGIQPLVTMFHWDLPQALEDEYGGFLSPKIVDDFRDYANICFKEFGDRVKMWEIAQREIQLRTEPYIVMHHLILSHANAVQLYKKKYQASQNGKVGVAVSCKWYVPKFDTIASKRAALRARDFLWGWIINPLIYGDYPKTMQDLVGSRLPNFTKQQSRMLKGSINFLGLNYYTARYANDCTYYNSGNLSYTTDSRVNITTEKNGIPIGEPTDVSWLYMYPRGIRDLLLYIKRRYNNPTIIITENGMGDLSDESSKMSDLINDTLRIKYHSLHLLYLCKAIKEGVDIRGYYIWSFLDDFEWAAGYTDRFGINYIDYIDGLKRYFKNSALWFSNFLIKENVAIATSSSLLYSE